MWSVAHPCRGIWWRRQRAVPDAPNPHALRARARRALIFATGRLRRGTEADKATDYWSRLPDYHLSNDQDPQAIERSEWVAKEVLPTLDVSSLLEVGTNSGRNLEIIKAAHPRMRLRGIDVNPRAIEFARSKGLDVEFEMADANRWEEGSWDCVLTMSVLDHIPNDAAEQLAGNIARSAKYVIAVELWDGADRTTGAYKYSRDTSALFSRHGFRTVRWAQAPGQYDTERSLLWAYVGARGDVPSASR